MAPVTPPVWQQAGSYTARLDRQAAAGLLTPQSSIGAMAARSGVKPNGANTSMQVAQRSTPDRWVQVLAGTCYIPATSSTGGTYICQNDATYDVQTTAAHATLARKDLIIARVRDAVDDTGALNSFAIEVVTGTPAGSPSQPALPSQSIKLAEVHVAAASTTVTNANITDLRARVVSLGGVLPVKNTTEWPATPYPGLTVYREDSGLLQFWNGSTWRTVYDDSYGSQIAFGCLAWNAWDLAPDWTTTSTTGQIAKYDGTNNVRLSYTIPNGVPAGRVIRFEAVMRAGVAPAGGANTRLNIQFLQDGSTAIGDERRPAIPNDSFNYEAHHTVLVAASVVSGGAHYIEPRFRVENVAVTATVTSMEMAVYLL